MLVAGATGGVPSRMASLFLLNVVEMLAVSTALSQAGTSDGRISLHPVSASRYWPTAGSGVLHIPWPSTVSQCSWDARSRLHATTEDRYTVSTSTAPPLARCALSISPGQVSNHPSFSIVSPPADTSAISRAGTELNTRRVRHS